MTSFTPSLRSQTFDSKSAATRGLNDDVLARRMRHRRDTLMIQFGSYFCTTIIIAIYATIGIIPVIAPVLYLCCGGLVNALFLATSQTGFNDRFDDHYLTVMQMTTHVTLQILFLIAMPQIGYVFLCITFVTCSFAALRMTPRQSLATWTFVTLSMMPIFLMTDLQIALPAATFLERLASLLMLSATVGQCAVVGLYGSQLRDRFYRGKEALKDAYERIEELAEIDELTGAFNRRSIMRKLDEEVARARRLERPLSVALIDLDWFKRINDTYGHPVGDEVLRTFSITIFANIREIDSFGRYGGEEFLIILPDTSKAKAEQLLNRLRLIVSDLDWNTLTPDMPVSISVGVAALQPGEASDTLLMRADAALYVAKRSGRNRVAGAV